MNVFGVIERGLYYATNLAKMQPILMQKLHHYHHDRGDDER